MSSPAVTSGVPADLIRGAPPTSPARLLAAAAARGRRLVGLAVLLVAWQVCASQGLLGAATPPPSQVLAAGAELIRSGELPVHLLASLERVAKGLSLGLTAGLVLGLAAGLFRLAEDVIDAPLQALRMLPHLALVPVFIIWFGIGETAKVALITIGPIFPLYINVFHGIRGVDERLVESARSCGVTGLALVRKVILPGALPQILVGLRQSLGIGWLSLVVAEMTATTSGIGFLVTDAKEFLRTDVVFVVLVVYALLGLATDLLVRAIERKALAWRRGLVAR
ncbi:ABC transporter permease [Thermopolyspora flexuosa]|jgi:sulfonate transport system permease protein|uniref:Sulfonate transport system permease protein n=1 Tax=Thermopolyspora flexuosa TaxID=103836 RepID=A0A543IXQ3_9ACTN|nr:ABC transporter permease [Thermopolyspora flexuosa]TQM75346.1 sulfonate transport system permease protein [Thermopolyspora flexuosa]GGM58607.1 ABC transporter permease [Thermopolyspora flexuosa]